MVKTRGMGLLLRVFYGVLFYKSEGIRSLSWVLDSTEL